MLLFFLHLSSLFFLHFHCVFSFYPISRYFFLFFYCLSVKRFYITSFRFSALLSRLLSQPPSKSISPKNLPFSTSSTWFSTQNPQFSALASFSVQYFSFTLRRFDFHILCCFLAVPLPSPTAVAAGFCAVLFRLTRFILIYRKRRAKNRRSKLLCRFLILAKQGDYSLGSAFSALAS